MEKEVFSKNELASFVSKNDVRDDAGVGDSCGDSYSYLVQLDNSDQEVKFQTYEELVSFLNKL